MPGRFFLNILSFALFDLVYIKTEMPVFIFRGFHDSCLGYCTRFGHVKSRKSGNYLQGFFTKASIFVLYVPCSTMLCSLLLIKLHFPLYVSIWLIVLFTSWIRLVTSLLGVYPVYLRPLSIRLRNAISCDFNTTVAAFLDLSFFFLLGFTLPTFS